MVRTISLIFLLLVACGGCQKKQATQEDSKRLVPTGREREILRAYGVNARTEAGQKRLVKLRVRQDKLRTSRERMRSWAEAKSQTENAEDEGNEDQPRRVVRPVIGMTSGNR
jgi:hypothetical protein